MPSLHLRFLLLDLHLCTGPNSPLVKGEYSGLPEGGGLVPAATTTRNPHLPKTNILKQISKPIRLPDPHSVPCLLSAWEIKLTGNKNVLKGHLNSARPMPMTDFSRSLYMRKIQNIAFFSISLFPAIQLHCFFERTTVAGGVPGAFNPGVAIVPLLPRVTQISSLRDFCSPYLSLLLLFLSFLYSPLPGGALPFAVDQKEVKVLSNLSFLPPHGFLFPAHIPEDPQKTAPAFAGPDYFDWPPLLFTFR